MIFKSLIILGIFVSVSQAQIGSLLGIGVNAGVNLGPLSVKVGVDADLSLGLQTEVGLDAAVRLGGTCITVNGVLGFLLSGVHVSAGVWPRASATVNGVVGLKIVGGQWAALQDTKRWSDRLLSLGLDARVSLGTDSFGLDATLYLHSHFTVQGGVPGFSIDEQFVAAVNVRGVQVLGADVVIKSYGRYTKIQAFASLYADVKASGYKVGAQGKADVKAKISVAADVGVST